ncbi:MULTISPECIES: hypothetical protein [Microbacterium]|uniref:Uncharacterized protein n=2 Tax=Microbacterium maritypicum TaxID=33918 RepID=A0AAJ5SJJ4_MICMQ|nr:MULTISPECIES: hypothetical protein [Microbacterium]EYT59746.1 hypothetical protein D514_0111545 [Microbacterium sp. UCD-TDU]MBP5801884.1 hypothetical protein [Microbacterium liquefaciens]UTT51467.1 hypothetical protein NMQ05_10195 [Microbacterium liquefaciens]WEF19532.1 hypothetical protein PWF71_09470 [Microbacterium liquefaciens]
MNVQQRGWAVTGLLLGGASILLGGTVLAVIQGAQIIGMGVQVLLAWLSYVPIFAEPNPRQIPTYDFFWPLLALLGGVAAFFLGWVVIIRGASLAWPTRFDRSQQNAS